MKFLALDIGQKRIGVATCDRLEVAASPHSVIKAGSRAVDAVFALVQAEDASAVIVGMPISLNGNEENQACDRVRAFVQKLETVVNIPVIPVDERMTTKIAEFSLIEAGMRREQRRDVIDAVSASLILRSFIDRRKSLCIPLDTLPERNS